MGEHSKIAWTDNTWSPWWGCTKLLDRRACDACYAAALARRVGRSCWGDTATRSIASERVWNEPLRWNEKAQEDGTRPRVFVMSMGDFLEDRPELEQWRKRAVSIIEKCSSLEWLILTKRIDNAHLLPWSPAAYPRHVRLGITVEDQGVADRDVPKLLDLRCRNFVSVEPMLGPIDFTHMDADGAGHPTMCWINALTGRHTDMGWPCPDVGRLDWVIVGAESAPGMTPCKRKGRRCGRPIDLAWVRSLRDQCVEAGTKFFYKQGPVDGRLVELPELDGRSWSEVP